MAYAYDPDFGASGLEADRPLAMAGAVRGTPYYATDSGRVYFAFGDAAGHMGLIGSGGEPVYGAVAASTANVNTASAPATLDGVTLVAGDIVLLKNQTTVTQNGLYTFSAAAAALTRLSTWDALADAIVPGTRVVVKGGTTNAKTEWAVASNGNPINFGTSNINFTHASGKTLFGSGTLDGGGNATIDAAIANGCAIVVTCTNAAAHAISAPSGGVNFPNNQFTVIGTAADTFNWVVVLP